MSTSRSSRWQELYRQAATDPHMRRAIRNAGHTLSKHTDALLAWYVTVDLRAIRRSEYRAPEDAEIRQALEEARAAAKRLSDLLWHRKRRIIRAKRDGRARRR